MDVSRVAGSLCHTQINAADTHFIIDVYACVVAYAVALVACIIQYSINIIIISTFSFDCHT